MRKHRGDLCVRATFIASLIVLLVSTRADARWHVDMQTGAFIPVGEVKFEGGPADLGLDLNDGAAFVIGGGYDFGRWVDLGAQFQTATTFGLFDDFATVYSFTVGARVFLVPPPSPVRPWLGTQIGWYRVHAGTDDLFNSDDIDRVKDSFGLNAGGGLDIPINQRVSLGIDVRYHNAFDAFHGFDFVTTMFNVSIWFGDDDRHRSDTPPVPRER